MSSAPSGNFVVVWQSIDQDGDYIGIFGQRYNADGTIRKGEFPANSFTAGEQSTPDVSVGGDGSFVVVWQGYGPNGDYGDVFARRFTSAGAPPGSEFQVNAPARGSYEGAAAVADVTSGFVVVWDDYDDVFARRFDATGAPLGTPISGQHRDARLSGIGSRRGDRRRRFRRGVGGRLLSTARPGR